MSSQCQNFLSFFPTGHKLDQVGFVKIISLEEEEQQVSSPNYPSMNAIYMSQRKSSVVGFFKFRLLLLQNDSQGRGAHELQKLCVTSLGFVATLCLVVYFTDLSIPDLFGSVLAFIPTGWAILCLSHGRGLWDSVREIARLYDAGVGMIKFAPVAILSWFPFASTFQSRLLLNQAFSHGLEISLILAGNKANIET